eukprot:CAMPEP_0119526648 /NCGR_PEP_ID=MMETSP1344-20130328/41223_1 /TAXON_ID=236787 /ORGANISM="Florenciella parvula, Strain CCMP2471" /LENGTH=32 /DNA_ID= /DNA_START= /DNA_END= /DNA_ORIENTATION=
MHTEELSVVSVEEYGDRHGLEHTEEGVVDDVT